MQAFLSSLLIYIPELLSKNTANAGGFFESLFVTLYATWRFWVKILFFMPLKATPCTVYTLVSNPQIIFSTYMLIFTFYFFLFFLVKRRITKRRIHTFFISTLVFTTLGFLLVYNLSFFFDLQLTPSTQKKFNSDGVCSVSTRRKQLLHAMALYSWKLLTALLVILLWAVLLYNGDPSEFTQLRTVRFSLWLFSLLALGFFVWAGVVDELYVLAFTEIIAFFLLQTLYGCRSGFFTCQARLSVVVFVASKLLIYSLLLLNNFVFSDDLKLVFKNSEFFTLIVFIWYLSWDYTLRTNLSSKDPTADAFINGVLRLWLLLNFFLIVPYKPTSAVLFFGFLVSIVYAAQSVQAVTAIPDFAWKRQRRVLMFGEAPEATEPEQLITSVRFNSNVFHVINSLSNVVFALLPVLLTITPKQSFSLVCISLVLFSSLVWFIYFTGAQLVMHFKTASVLDWRGLFLVMHDYNWAMRYTLNILNTLIVVVLFWFSAVAALVIFNARTSLLFVFCFIVLLLLVCYVIYRFYFLWSRIFAHFRDSSYECWTDEFWEETSPFMRDFLYWRPLEPDDAEEVDPAFYGFTSNGASKGLMLLFVYVALLFFYTNPAAMVVVNVSFFLWFYKVWVFYILFTRFIKLYNFDLYSEKVLSIIDYMWYEFGTYLLMAFLMSVINYFIITQVFLGMFWLLFFFTA